MLSKKMTWNLPTPKGLEDIPHRRSRGSRRDRAEGKPPGGGRSAANCAVIALCPWIKLHLKIVFNYWSQLIHFIF